MRKGISIVLGLVACASVWLFIQHVVYKPIRDAENSDVGDFLAFYMAAYRLPQGEDIYNLPATQKQAKSMGIRKGPPEITYPPFSIVPFVPLAQIFNPMDAFRFVVVLYTVLYWATLPILLRTFRLQISWNMICGGIILFSLYTPAWGTIDTGQINMVVLFFVSIGLLYITKNKDVCVGSAFGLAASAKLFPGVAVVEFLIQRRYRTVLSMVFLGITILVLSLAISGTSPYKRFLSRKLPHNIKVVHGGVHDVSAKSFIHRVFVNGRIKGPRDYRLSLTHRYSRIAGGVLMAFSGLILLLGIKKRIYMPLRICFLLTLLLIISPWTWTHHLVMALPCLVAVAAHILYHRGRFRIVMAVGVSLSYILMAIGYRFHIRVRPGDSLRELLQSSSMNLYGILILYFLIALLLLQSRKGDAASAN